MCPGGDKFCADCGHSLNPDAVHPMHAEIKATSITCQEALKVLKDLEHHVRSDRLRDELEVARMTEQRILKTVKDIRYTMILACFSLGVLCVVALLLSIM